MSTLSLFDLTILRARLADPKTVSGNAAINQMMRVAENLVASLNSRFEQVEALDEALVEAMGKSADEDLEEDAFDAEMSLVFRSMYEECAREAERVLLRVDRLERNGRKVKDSNALRNWYGRTMARLSITLDAIAHSMDDVRQGRVFSLAEVRNDLFARLRP
jgi:hypothetical protein